MHVEVAGAHLLVVQVEHGQERLLRHLDAADLLHPLLALLLLLEQLPLAADVAAVALREHVLPLRLDRLASDDPGADRGLDRDVEELARDLLPEPLDEQLAPVVGEFAVDDQRERVDRLAGDEDVDAHEVSRLEAGHVVVEARVAAGARLQLVVEVEHDLAERQLVDEVHALLGEVLHVVEAAAAVVAELHHRADVLLRDDDRRLDVRLLDLVDLDGHVRGVVHLDPVRAGTGPNAVGDVRRGHDQVEVELALQPLTHDLHVQQAEEAAAEAEAERLRGLGLVEERAVVQLQPLERVTQLRVGIRVRREEPGEDHRLDLFVAGQRLGGRPLLARQRVPDAELRDVLQARDHVADLARFERLDRAPVGREEAELLRLEARALRHRP